MGDRFVLHEVQQRGQSVGSVHRPSSVEEALETRKNTENARFIAGGTDLLLDLARSGNAAGRETDREKVGVDLIDTTGIEGFHEIREQEDQFWLAGGVRHGQVVQDQRFVEFALPLAQACLEVGSPQLRNRATIAGNLATASPANDTISALMALGASVELSKLDDNTDRDDNTDKVVSRQVLVADFFTGFRNTVLDPAELITAIVVPKLKANQRGLWVKLGLRRAQAISVVHAGLVISFDEDIIAGEPVGDRAITDVRLALGSVAPTVVLSSEFAGTLVGHALSPDRIAEAARAASGGVAPISDGRATADYRSDGVEVTIRRALQAVAAGQHAAMWPDSPPTLSSPAQLSTTAEVGQTPVHPATNISIELNGEVHSAPARALTLLDWVRDQVGLTGMKEGCAEGECGACTMTLDGAAVMSCLVTAAQADGSTVTTVDGLDHPIQAAFIDEFAVQCGFCIPGFLMAGARLLEENDSPSNEQIEHAFSGNLCRCTGYYPIVEAVHAAAVEIRASND